MWFVYSKGDQLPDGALLPSLSYSQRSRAHCRVGAERPPSSGRTLSCTFVAPSIAAVVAATSQEGGYCVLQNHSDMSARAPTAASVSCSGPHRRSSGGRLSPPFDSHQTCFIQTRTVPTILGLLRVRQLRYHRGLRGFWFVYCCLGLVRGVSGLFGVLGFL